MDYEKAYKAMVQRVKELHKDGNALTKQQMEIVCPELAENDDEKIRNDIMKAVENWLPYERVEEIRAYLNAQKWQQSDGKAMFHVSEKSYQIGYRDGKMEQNPAEWGEKDEECRKELIQYIEQRIGDGTTGQSLWKKWHSWLCSLPLNLKKRKEQKPKPFSCGHENGSSEKPNNQWSDEDEEMRNECVMALSNWRDAMSNYGYEVALSQRLIDWLKSLRPSWKPSDQEMCALRTAIHILTNEKNLPKAAGHLQAILDAFEGKKSRKDWKPSEEQMAVLDKVYHYLWADKNATADMQDGLGDFIDELKGL